CPTSAHVGYSAGQRTRAAQPPGPFVLSEALYTKRETAGVRAVERIGESPGVGFTTVRSSAADSPTASGRGRCPTRRDRGGTRRYGRANRARTYVDQGG